MLLYDKIKLGLLATLTALAIVVGVFTVVDLNTITETARNVNTTAVFVNSYIPLIKAEIAAASGGVF